MTSLVPTETPSGPLRVAARALPPSPDKPGAPVPATVVTTSVSTSTCSKHMRRAAVVAVLMVVVVGAGRCRSLVGWGAMATPVPPHHSHSVVAGVGDDDTPRGQDGDVGWAVELQVTGWFRKMRELAGAASGSREQPFAYPSPVQPFRRRLGTPLCHCRRGPTAASATAAEPAHPR